ncbi:hypothetical protein [Actinomadura geliboluensis]
MRAVLRAQNMHFISEFASMGAGQQTGRETVVVHIALDPQPAANGASA